MSKQGWIGVDLDRTLFEYHTNPQGYDPLEIGDPLWPMINRVKGWLANTQEVRIFTARASGFDLETVEGRAGKALVIDAIHRKLESVGLPALEVTNEKDYKCIQIWDDIAVAVWPNTGNPVVIPSSIS